MTTMLINGVAATEIAVSDRGLQYGDGLFETMKVEDGKIRLWPLHWQRLSQGCERLAIPLIEQAQLEAEMNKLIQQQAENCFVLKLIITRGSSARGYAFAEPLAPTRILACYPLPQYPPQYQQDGVCVRYCDTLLSENPLLAGLKHLNRLEQVMARNEWHNDDYQEGLMSTAAGHVVDGIMSNLFAVKDGKLFTPSLEQAGVAGVMRQHVINCAKQAGIAVYASCFSRSELEDADELFLSNSLFGIWPIRVIGKTRFTRAGRLTRQLQEAITA